MKKIQKSITVHSLNISLQTSFKYHMGIILYGYHLGIKTNLKFVNLPWDSWSLHSEIQQVVTHGGGVVKHGCKCFKQATKTRLVNLILNAKSIKFAKDFQNKIHDVPPSNDNLQETRLQKAYIFQLSTRFFFAGQDVWHHHLMRSLPLFRQVVHLSIGQMAKGQ